MDCPFCTTDMTLLSKDGLWHICPECFHQEPNDNGKVRHDRHLPVLEDA